jgi:OHCU decarboxylase
MGRPGRAQSLQKFLDYANSFEDVWFATRAEIADHWASTHPHVRFERPSEMTKDTFTQTYGGIFEHSKWIAEGAFELELGAAHDTAIGLHNALARIFRSASEDKRLSVLTAHPDLAGKLAAAKRLTAESTSEQAAAGLSALTDDERTQFTKLNDAYVAKHGFPFIIAVRDHTKSSILAAFERRIETTRSVEFSEACRQVERIAEFRLKDLLP